MLLIAAQQPDALIALTLTIWSAQAAAIGILWRRVTHLQDQLASTDRHKKRILNASRRRRP